MVHTWRMARENEVKPLGGVSNNAVDNTDSGTPSKKQRRCMDKRTYLEQFKPFIRERDTDVIVATPDRVRKENIHNGYVAEAHITTVIPCDGVRLLETSDQRVGKCTSPFSEVQRQKNTDTCPQNRANESSLAVEARDEPSGSARQADSSMFLEHWVPAYISQLQLEKYCSILLSSSSVLQSQKKTDSARALRNILMALTKCCDHPYLIDESLESSPANNHDQTESIDTMLHACGKLGLLNKMLKETQQKRLRVIILFQYGAAGWNSLGDILEGVVCHRFGPESYERIEYGALRSRKQMAVKMFNDKTKGRSVFLIENHACFPSIELSSVDAIIIYNSDWNPVNDLKALKKIKIESQFKYLSIFRLYCPFTMEEKKLMFAKQGMPIDTNIQDMKYTLSHSLISWGAPCLFSRLDELQQDNNLSKSSERNSHFMDKIISEFIKKLPTCVEVATKIHSASISKANMSGEFYSRSITLIGEIEGMPALDGDPSKFWLNLLDGRSPCWSYISEPPQSSHRTLQNLEEPLNSPAEEANEARIKRRKFGEIMGPSSKSHDDALPENCTASFCAIEPLDVAHPKLGVQKLMAGPNSLHDRLNQDLSKLVKVLQLPDNVSIMVEKLHEYILKNCIVALEPAFMLHALNIAVCLHSASLLNYNLDCKELLALAKKHMNYGCNEGLATLFYKKLRILKKKFSHRANEGQPMLVEDTEFSWQETSTNWRNSYMFQKQGLNLHGNFTNGAPQGGSCAEQMFAEGQELLSVQETHRDCHLSNGGLLNMTVEKRMYLVDNVFSLREKCILDNQQLQISDLETHTHNCVIRLKEVCNLVLEHICRSHTDEMANNDKKKLTIQWFTMLMYAFLEHMRLQHNKLEALQSNAWSEEQQLKESLQKEAKTGQLDETFDQRIALPESNFVIEDFILSKEQNDEYHIVESSESDCQQPSYEGSLMEIALVKNVVPPGSISKQPVQNEPVEVLVDSGGRPASEALHITENNIRSSSDGIGLQNVGCSSSTIPAKDCTIGQESLTGNLSSMSAQQSARDLQLEAQPSTRMEDQYLSAETEFTGIPGMEAVVDLQSELQPSTSMQDLVERASLLDTMTTQHLQPEMQPSISMQHVPFERTHLCANPVVQNQTDQQSVEPSCDPCAGAESAGTSCMVTAHDLLSEIQASTSMHKELAEAERPGMLGKAAAQDLQPEMQSSATVKHAPLERTHSEERNQISFQPNMIPGAERPIQLLPPATSVFYDNPTVSVETLKNEFHELTRYRDYVSIAHEHKHIFEQRSLLETEYNQETEKVKMKYKSSLQIEDSIYLQRKKATADIYKKVFLHRSLAEKFREKFTGFSAAQVGSTILETEQRLPLVPHGSNGFAGAQTHDVQPQTMLPGNLYGATSPPLVPTPRPHGSYSHLQQLRTRSPYAIQTNQQQQQLPVGPQVPRQSVPAAMGNSASTTQRGGFRLTSMAPCSSHQTMVSDSNPIPGFRPSLPPSLCPGIRSTSDLLNAAPARHLSGAQIPDGNQSGHQSRSLNSRLPQGLSSGAAGATPEVHCLSDDD